MVAYALRNSGLLAVLVVVLVLFPFAYLVANIQPAGINANFISALGWVKNNTPQNATFLSAWPDGSLIEGVAQRQSWSDSIQSSGYGMSFGAFLFAHAGNLTYLNSTKPDYLLVRYILKNESYAIATEASMKPIYNGSNLQALLNGSIVNITHGYLKEVFINNDTIIYKVS
jgi:hypothetical protein